MLTFSRQLPSSAIIRARRNADLRVRPIVTPEIAQVVQGNSVNIDLHTNEPSSRDRTKTRITQKPAFGSATLSNGILTYTPAAGWLGYDFIGYQLANSDGVYGLTGYCTVQTIQQVIVNPEGEIPLPDIDLTVSVNTQSELNTEISNHTSSTVFKEIVVANGTYTFPTIASSKKNLMIRAQNVNGAKFTGRGSLKGTNVILRGLWIPSGVDIPEHSAGAPCDQVRISRCRVDGNANDGIWMNGKDMLADGNDCSNSTQGMSGDGMRTCRITRNYVHDSGGAPDRCMYLGHGGTNQAPLDLTVDHNRTERIQDHQHVEHKSSNNITHHHHAIGTSGYAIANIYSRHGQNNVYSHCYVENGVIGAADEGNLIADCIAVSSSGKGSVARSGLISGDDIRTTDKTGIVYAEDAIIRRCSGPVGIGWNNGGDTPTAPKRTKLEGISSSQVYYDVGNSSDVDYRSPTGAPLFDEPAGPLHAVNDVGQFWNTN